VLFSSRPLLSSLVLFHGGKEHKRLGIMEVDLGTRLRIFELGKALSQGSERSLYSSPGGTSDLHFA
jgi:hypothetical protein